MADTNSPNAPRRAAKTLRQQEALDLRRNGFSYTAIGAELGITPQAAHQLVNQALNFIRDKLPEDAEKCRQVEIERLDAAQAVVSKILTSEKTSAETRLAAVDRMVRIAARRSALLGLDAPAKTDLTTNGESVQFILTRGPEKKAGGDGDTESD